jgi:hypothetical protein
VLPSHQVHGDSDPACRERDGTDWAFAGGPGC